MAGRGHVPLTIRRATPADAATVATLQVRGHRFAYAGLLPQPESDDDWIARRADAWRPQLAPDHERHTLVAERDGAPVGFVTVGPTDVTALPPGTGHLFALYVEPAVIGSGIGHALTDGALATLRARGFTAVVLWVLEENARARRFYERAGFAFDGTRRDEERDGHARHELRYVRAL